MGTGPEIRVTTLGSVRIHDGESDVADALRDKGRPNLYHAPKRLALFLYLAVEREVSREAALDIFWGHKEPHRARGTLNNAVYELNLDFDFPWLDVSSHSFSVADAVTVDVHDFESAIKTESFAEALAVYALYREKPEGHAPVTPGGKRPADGRPTEGREHPYHRLQRDNPGHQTVGEKTVLGNVNQCD